MNYREVQDGDLLVCNRCKAAYEVSPEDPDASVGDMLHHLRVVHGLTGQQAANAMKLVDRTGRTIQ
jgi:hypothetical protein